MGDYEDLPYIVIERRSGGLGPFVWGALLGAGAALLLTPRSGRETQAEIRGGLDRLRDVTTGRVHDARDTVTGAVTRTRNRIYDRIDNVRDDLEARAQQAREAIEAGRRAAREARGDLERRVHQARDGYVAATEAARAAAAPPHPPADVDVVVTEVIVEEVQERPDLG